MFVGMEPRRQRCGSHEVGFQPTKAATFYMQTTINKNTLSSNQHLICKNKYPGPVHICHPHSQKLVMLKRKWAVPPRAPEPLPSPKAINLSANIPKIKIREDHTWNMNNWGFSQALNLLYSSITLLATYSNPDYLYNKNKVKAKEKQIEESSSYSNEKVVSGSFLLTWPHFRRLGPLYFYF